LKLLQVYNQYRSAFNGEETVVVQIAQLVERHGGEARLWMRTSRDLDAAWSRKMQAFFSGIYNRRAYRDMRRVLREYQPDVVHVHNLYPLFSPSILVACRDERTPVVVTVHNQQLTCPKADHLYRGQVCERCVGGREYHCVLQNCRGNIFESVAYAARSSFARRLRFFHQHVTLLIALSEFGRSRLVKAGFSTDQIVVLPNMTAEVTVPADPARGRYVAFAGRLSPEKGVETLLEASRALPEVPLRLAGDGPLFETLRERSPSHATLMGPLDRDAMHRLYAGARFLVLPSRTFEMCPLVVLEAMSHGLPVIASRLGAQAELVEDGVTGLLFAPHDPADLQAKMRQLWHDDQACRRLGQAGREKVMREHSQPVYHRRLMEIYGRAMGRQPDDTPAAPAALEAAR